MNGLNWIKTMALATIGVFFIHAAAVAQGIKVGKDYEALPKQFPTSSDKGKIEVIEFFSYGCAHCASFEPVLEKWAKANASKITLIRSHVLFEGTRWSTKGLIDLHYTLAAMGKIEALHTKIFDAVQKNRVNFDNEEQRNKWLGENGINEKKYTEMLKSFGVQSQIKSAIQRQNDMGVESTPQMVVDGQYRVIGQSSLENIVEVAGALVTRAQYEKKSSPQTKPTKK